MGTALRMPSARAGIPQIRNLGQGVTEKGLELQVSGARACEQNQRMGWKKSTCRFHSQFLSHHCQHLTSSSIPSKCLIVLQMLFDAPLFLCDGAECKDEGLEVRFPALSCTSYHMTLSKSLTPFEDLFPHLHSEWNQLYDIKRS